MFRRNSNDQKETMSEIDSDNQFKQTPSGGTCRACMFANTRSPLCLIQWIPKFSFFTGMLFDDSSRMIFLFERNNNLAEIFSKCTSLVVVSDRIIRMGKYLQTSSLLNFLHFRKQTVTTVFRNTFAWIATTIWWITISFDCCVQHPMHIFARMSAIKQRKSISLLRRMTSWSREQN